MSADCQQELQLCVCVCVCACVHVCVCVMHNNLLILREPLETMSIYTEDFITRLQAAIFLRRSTRNQFLYKDA